MLSTLDSNDERCRKSKYNAKFQWYFYVHAIIVLHLMMLHNNTIEETQNLICKSSFHIYTLIVEHKEPTRKRFPSRQVIGF